jgi:hypothetical protein
VPSSGGLKTEGSNDLQSECKKLNNNSIFNSQSKIKKNANLDFKSDDDIYYEGIGEMVPSMDELKDLLSNEPPDVKEKILGMMLTWAFHPNIQSNPLKKIYLWIKYDMLK